MVIIDRQTADRSWQYIGVDIPFPRLGLFSQRVLSLRLDRRSDILRIVIQAT